MAHFQVDGLGTTWVVLVDGTEQIRPAVEKKLGAEIIRFDETYSRFKPTSLLSKINHSPKSVFTLEPELEKQLQFAVQLSLDTYGTFDANIASWEAAYGYDETYNFSSTIDVELPKKGAFEIKNHQLIKHGRVELDTGAFGKGYLIDLLAQMLLEEGYQHFLVDGGRDFFSTTKADGSPWQIGMEHPTDPELLIGIAQLKNQGFAASNSFHRRVGEFHHLLSGQTGRPVNQLASVFVVADTAMQADGISTAMFVSDQTEWSNLEQQFEYEYLTVTETLKLKMSTKFPGELFFK